MIVDPSGIEDGGLKSVGIGSMAIDCSRATAVTHASTPELWRPDYTDPRDRE
jgi:hypothetical protein